MAKVISFGDSFTWGTDLADAMPAEEWEQMPQKWKSQNPFDTMYSRKTWPALMAQHFDQDYICLAKPGCSNQTIVRKFFENIHLIERKDTVVVNFTWRDRYDFYNDEKREWTTVRPSGTEDNEYHELYYKYLHCTMWDQVENLKAINLIMSWLDKNQSSYIVTCIDELIFDDPWYRTPLIETLQNQYVSDITWFEKKGFHQWAKDKGFAISEAWHPLEEAHAAAWEYINEFA